MNYGIFLLLGTNEGRRSANLQEALKSIKRDAGSIERLSSVYKSAAWGMEEQPHFYNQVIEISSPHPAELLLKKILDIEQRMGRVRKQKWGPRLIDIDLLLYGSEIRSTASLRLPHPGIPQRKFTLVPLAEIAGNLIHPVLKKTINTLLIECRDPLHVERLVEEL